MPLMHYIALAPKQVPLIMKRFLTAAEDIMTKLSDHTADNNIFMSDMNFGNCYSKNPILTPKPLDDRAPELFQGFGYTQVIDIPT